MCVSSYKRFTILTYQTVASVEVRTVWLCLLCVILLQVGYPNVGKSSTINTLFQGKKVPVSATPGRTKHFQVCLLHLPPLLCLCLISSCIPFSFPFPSFPPPPPPPPPPSPLTFSSLSSSLSLTASLFSCHPHFTPYSSHLLLSLIPSPLTPSSPTPPSPPDAVHQ